jgi:tetratricopeptide (TPR) repeat protein
MKKEFSTGTLAILALLSFGQDAKMLYNEGVKLKGEKNTKQAAEKFKKALDLDKNYTEARYELGWCQNDMKEYQSAVINLREVRKVWPAVSKVHFELGYAFEKTTNYDSAIACYTKCLEIKPDYSGVYKQLGGIAYARDQYPPALEYFNKYITLSAKEITDYFFWYQKGYCENANKDFSSAITSFQTSLKYKTDYLNTYLELGFAASRLKQNEDAIRYYKQAIEIDSKSHIPYNGIGEVYRDNYKNREEAMTWYRKALDINPSERKACFGMGYCLNSQQKYTEAIPYLKTAIEKENTYTAAYVELGYSYYKTNQNAEAMQNLNKALTLNPKSENARYYLTLLYINEKNKTKAQQMVDELKNLNSPYVTELQNKVNTM